MSTPEVAVVMGSDSDWAVMKQCCEILDQFGVPYHKQVLSAHRTARDMIEFGENAKANGHKILVAGAGGAAHLPGMLAAATVLPVIGVPVRSSQLSGVDSLLSIVQMPKGVPVATVAVNNAANAGLLALSMLAISDESLSKKLENYRIQMADESRKKTENLIG